MPSFQRDLVSSVGSMLARTHGDRRREDTAWKVTHKRPSLSTPRQAPKGMNRLALHLLLALGCLDGRFPMK